MPGPALCVDSAGLSCPLSLPREAGPGDAGCTKSSQRSALEPEPPRVSEGGRQTEMSKQRIPMYFKAEDVPFEVISQMTPAPLHAPGQEGAWPHSPRNHGVQHHMAKPEWSLHQC